MKNETHVVRLDVTMEVEAPDEAEAIKRGKHSVEQGLSIIGASASSVRAHIVAPEAEPETAKDLTARMMAGDEEAGKEAGERVAKALFGPMMERMLDWADKKGGKDVEAKGE